MGTGWTRWWVGIGDDGHFDVFDLKVIKSNCKRPAGVHKLVLRPRKLVLDQAGKLFFLSKKEKKNLKRVDQVGDPSLRLRMHP